LSSGERLRLFIELVILKEGNCNHKTLIIMMIRIIFFLLYASFLFKAYPAFTQPFKVDVSASSAILINAETGKILYEKNAQQKVFPASTTKIATALLTLTKKPDGLQTLYCPSQEAIGCVSPQVRRAKHPSYRLEYGGTHMGIKNGEQLPYQDLLYGLMLASANDAANALAEWVSGNVQTFMDELNQFLKEIGCLNTHFTNPHGLPCPEHKTTAYDLAKMAQAAMKIPTFREIVKTPRYTKEATNKQEKTTLVQGNALLRSGPHYYPKAIGVKTGYTISAGQNIVAAAKDENRYLIAVVLGCKDYHQKFKDAVALFEAAFQEPKMHRTLFAKGYDLFTREVKGAKEAVQASLNEDLSLEYYASEAPKFKAILKWRELKLPIAEGQAVGEIQLVDQESGKILKSGPILAKNSVEETLIYKIFGFLNKVRIILSHRIAILFFIVSIFAGALWLYSRKKLQKVVE
jgi:D-alanyl-D-alanine carboxypeptidase (penicillin-binding protein 5/6)